MPSPEMNGPLDSAALARAVVSRLHADETRARIGLIIPSSNRMAEAQFRQPSQCKLGAWN